jgi:NhaA family Na+:H+ antiporter
MALRVTNFFKTFFESEKAGGLLLGIATVLSLVIANNTAFGESYRHFWHTNWALPFNILSLSVEAWINDALMAVFFLMVGLEIKRELLDGELSNRKRAFLPFFGAIGGVIVPVLIHRGFNHGQVTEAGAGIPMATDIAFAIAMLSLLGNRIPLSLRVFLTALAIIDDLMAILVIAFFYNAGIQWTYLSISLGIWLVLLGFNRLKIKWIGWYLIPAIGMWYCMHLSGIHATIAGVLLAFALPFDRRDDVSLSHQVEKWLLFPVSFIIMPLFALANMALFIQPNWMTALGSSNALGIMFGLGLGKMIGISLACWLTAAIGLSSIPKVWGRSGLIGVSMLGGIGFTMSIFITMLSFPNQPEIIEESKIAILMASLFSATMGYLILVGFSRKSPVEKD